MAPNNSYLKLTATVADLARLVATDADRLAAVARELPPTATGPDLANLRTAFTLLVSSTQALRNEHECLDQPIDPG